MSQFGQQPKSRFKPQNGDSSVFKSSIFEHRSFHVPKHLEQNGKKIDFFHPKQSILDENSSENFRTASRPMFSSSMFGLQKKSSTGGGLLGMARHVEDPVQDTNGIDEKEKNKYSFLQVPKVNLINHEGLNSQFKAMKSSTMYQPSGNKVPSFLKKDARSSCDPNEERTEPSFKKQQSNKKSEQTKSQVQQKYPNQAQTTSLQNSSPLLLKSKGSIKSPTNASTQNKSYGDQRDQASSKSNLLDPSTVPQKGHQRKGSLIMQNQKQFYTPTQKNSAFKLGSSNFIEIAQKYNTSSKIQTKSSQFLSVSSAQKDQCPSPRDDNKTQKQKVLIPSFIKFKEKRNDLIKTNSTESKKFVYSATTSQTQLEAGQKKWKVENFEIKERLGKGAFGDVYLARQKQTGFVCVLKKLSKQKIKQQNTQQLIMREIKIQSYFSHKHITNLYGFFDDNQFIYLIMEYMSQGSLAQKLNRKKCPEKQAAQYIKQVCDGLRFMHIENVIHRDIKPENVFMCEDYIKLGDFGCSVFSDSKRNTMVGSLAYFSPEQLNNESYDEKIDVWSVGILSYELLTGRSPFQQDILKIARQEKDAKLSELRFPTKLDLSQEAKDFTRRLLTQNPDDRMTINESLKHPFITKNNLPLDNNLLFTEVLG